MTDKKERMQCILSFLDSPKITDLSEINRLHFRKPDTDTAIIIEKS